MDPVLPSGKQTLRNDNSCTLISIDYTTWNCTPLVPLKFIILEEISTIWYPTDDIGLRGTFMAGAPINDLYLFLFHPCVDVQDGVVSVEIPSAQDTYYWSFWPDGREPLSAELFNKIMPPQVLLDDYQLFRDITRVKGLDPERSDLAIQLGYPLAVMHDVPLSVPLYGVFARTYCFPTMFSTVRVSNKLVAGVTGKHGQTSPYAHQPPHFLRDPSHGRRGIISVWGASPTTRVHAQRFNHIADAAAPAMVALMRNPSMRYLNLGRTSVSPAGKLLGRACCTISLRISFGNDHNISWCTAQSRVAQIIEIAVANAKNKQEQTGRRGYGPGG
ncbi:hypothetical protein GGX14DRAFT_392915 [Mycena pura]|uniref:Uncharacterized protein n=1 Tax=Mycena pura TaxID=153505 RepID=A0AAD6YF19_9AGAR|nr:hypothetical protein GGX14DRAFT_392915 [Mycena pura]